MILHYHGHVHFSLNEFWMTYKNEVDSLISFNHLLMVGFALILWSWPNKFLHLIVNFLFISFSTFFKGLLVSTNEVTIFNSLFTLPMVSSLDIFFVGDLFMFFFHIFSFYSFGLGSGRFNFGSFWSYCWFGHVLKWTRICFWSYLFIEYLLIIMI